MGPSTKGTGKNPVHLLNCLTWRVLRRPSTKGTGKNPVHLAQTLSTSARPYPQRRGRERIPSILRLDAANLRLTPSTKGTGKNPVHEIRDVEKPRDGPLNEGDGKESRP